MPTNIHRPYKQTHAQEGVSLLLIHGIFTNKKLQRNNEVEKHEAMGVIIFFLNVSFLSDGDPKNYLTYFRRATVYLALGKSRSALPDLNKVLELRPDFTAVS